MRPRSVARCLLVGAALLTALSSWSAAAHAGEARVTVGVPATDFARPPRPVEEAPVARDPRDMPIASDDRDCDPDTRPARGELYRAPFRLSLGPAFVTTGRGLGA